MKTVSILIVTYNQELCIARTLDSALRQKQYGLKEIVVSDDCSKDRTIDIVAEYQTKYPNIVKAYQNEKNLGIYGNFNKVVKLRGDSDYYYILAGDDELCDGYLETLQTKLGTIQEDPQKTSIAVYSDWKSVTPSGKETVYYSSIIEKYPDKALSLKFRGLIFARSVFISKKLIENYKDIDLSKGLSFAEEMFDSRVQQYAEKNYYFPFVGSIYYSNIGVSKTLGIEYKKEDAEKWELIAEEFKYKLDKYDQAYLRYKSLRGQFYITPSLELMFQSLYANLYGQLPKYARHFGHCFLSCGAMLRYYILGK